MCGRYEFNDEMDIEEVCKILLEINKVYTPEDYQTGEIYPKNHVPVLSLLDHKPILSIMTWGFPKWDGKGIIINAKAETAREKKMFACPLREKRCVIPATGFFEWSKKEARKTKEKFLFRTKESPMLYMAGLHNLFDGDDGKQQESFVILTREANASICDIHDRMPVILYRNELSDWLRDDKFTEYIFRRDNVMLERSRPSSS